MKMNLFKNNIKKSISKRGFIEPFTEKELDLKIMSLFSNIIVFRDFLAIKWIIIINLKASI